MEFSDVRINDTSVKFKNSGTTLDLFEGFKNLFNMSADPETETNDLMRNSQSIGVRDSAQHAHRGLF